MDTEVDVKTARAAGLSAFPSEAGTVVYVDRALRDPGATAIGPLTLRAEARAVLVFRDEQPGANWMHRCSYALVDPSTRAVLARATTDRPPVFGPLPASWIVASDPDHLADLVRRADSP